MKSWQTQCLFYHGKGRVEGERAWGRIPEFVDIPEVRERRRLCLERILTTGLAPEEYSRYSCQKPLKNPGGAST